MTVIVTALPPPSATLSGLLSTATGAGVPGTSSHAAAAFGSHHWVWSSPLVSSSSPASRQQPRVLPLVPQPRVTPIVSGDGSFQVFRGDASLVQFVESVPEQVLNWCDFELSIECVMSGWVYSWTGRLAFAPSNSRGDWGIAVDPACLHVNLAYQGEASLGRSASGPSSPASSAEDALRVGSSNPGSPPSESKSYSPLRLDAGCLNGVPLVMRSSPASGIAPTTPVISSPSSEQPNGGITAITAFAASLAGFRPVMPSGRNSLQLSAAASVLSVSSSASPPLAGIRRRPSGGNQQRRRKKSSEEDEEDDDEDDFDEDEDDDYREGRRSGGHPRSRRRLLVSMPSSPANHMVPSTASAHQNGRPHHQSRSHNRHHSHKHHDHPSRHHHHSADETLGSPNYSGSFAGSPSPSPSPPANADLRPVPLPTSVDNRKSSFEHLLSASQALFDGLYGTPALLAAAPSLFPPTATPVAAAVSATTPNPTLLMVPFLPAFGHHPELACLPNPVSPPATPIPRATGFMLIPVVTPPHPFKAGYNWELSSTQARPFSAVTIDAVGFSPLPALRNEPYTVQFHLLATVGSNLGSSTPAHTERVLPLSANSLKVQIPSLPAPATSASAITRVFIVIVDSAQFRVNQDDLVLDIIKDQEADKRLSLTFIM